MFFKNRLEIKNQPQDIGTMPATQYPAKTSGNSRGWKVYQITTNMTSPPLVYVGRTDLPIRQRFALHVIDYYNWKEGKNCRPACRSRDVLAYEDAHIDLLEDGIETREQSGWRERYWYDLKKKQGFNVVNRCRPRITDEEERETKRESERRNPKTEAQKQRKREKDKIRNSKPDNKEKNRERAREKRKDPEFRKYCRDKAREYRAKKKEQMLLQDNS